MGAADLAVVFDAVVKASVVLALTAIAAGLLRRASASARHAVWTLGLGGALLVPVLTTALPRWELPIVRVPADASLRLTSEATTPIAGPEAPALPAMARTIEHRVAAADAGAAPPRSAAGLRIQLNVATLLFAVWAIGAALILGRMLLGLLAVQWMSRRTPEVTDAPWLSMARALARNVGVSARVRFLRSGAAAMPMAWGILRPSVLMPAEADGWPVARLRIVLLHELAHVKRRDCLTHLFAQVVCAAYWFNPLAWMASRRLRTERERACDDLVLAAGTRGSDYADQLLDIARVMRAGRFPAVLAGATLAMAHRTQLEGRLIAILDPTVRRHGLSRMRAALAGAVFAAVLVPLASVQPWAEERPQSAPPQPTTVAQAAPAPASTATAQPAPAPAQERRSEETSAPRHGIRGGIEGGIKGGIAGGIVGGILNGIATGVSTGISTGVSTGIAEGTAAGVDGVAAQIADTVADTIAPTVDAAIAGARRGQDAKPVDPKTVAALAEALKDSDAGVRNEALQALARLRDPRAFEALQAALKDSSPDVREKAAFGLGQFRDPRAVEPLSAALKDTNADVREQAAFALGQIRNRSAVPALMAAIKDSAANVRQQVVFALGQLRDPSAIDALSGAVHDQSADVREQAAFALGQIRDARAVDALIPALKDEAKDVREQAAFALGQIRSPRAVDALVIALKDAVPDVREQIVFALGQIRDARAIDALTAALKDPNASVRQQAAFAIGQIAR
jgi:HEAT repeat protein/beta-lactamase regulating signal transducer with metallopeptidase domain